ncbi:hypothetical protein PIB30_001826 [Stylosanthes scabra]|uniref:Uncharacterized protein n=1 Tax=Stylosanthes scabra TaxID=79078 RepID=A0ABU6W342_9FABA|nr:hypothetical protein [Stylosanthes scabra]
MTREQKDSSEKMSIKPLGRNTMNAFKKKRAPRKHYQNFPEKGMNTFLKEALKYFPEDRKQSTRHTQTTLKSNEHIHFPSGGNVTDWPNKAQSNNQRSTYLAHRVNDRTKRGKIRYDHEEILSESQPPPTI